MSLGGLEKDNLSILDEKEDFNTQNILQNIDDFESSFLKENQQFQEPMKDEKFEKIEGQNIFSQCYNDPDQSIILPAADFESHFHIQMDSAFYQKKDRYLAEQRLQNIPQVAKQENISFPVPEPKKEVVKKEEDMGYARNDEMEIMDIIDIIEPEPGIDQINIEKTKADIIEVIPNKNCEKKSKKGYKVYHKSEMKLTDHINSMLEEVRKLREEKLKKELGDKYRPPVPEKQKIPVPEKQKILPYPEKPRMQVKLPMPKPKREGPLLRPDHFERQKEEDQRQKKLLEEKNNESQPVQQETPINQDFYPAPQSENTNQNQYQFNDDLYSQDYQSQSFYQSESQYPDASQNQQEISQVTYNDQQQILDKSGKYSDDATQPIDASQFQAYTQDISYGDAPTQMNQ